MIRSEQTSHNHRPIELLVDDPEITAIFDLRLDDLRDDLLPLDSAGGTGLTEGWVVHSLNAAKHDQLVSLGICTTTQQWDICSITVPLIWPLA